MNTIHSIFLMNSYRIPPRLRLVATRLGSLVLLFQRMPIVQFLFPEANIIGGASLANSATLAVTTVVGLGAYDSVAGQTTIVQNSPLAGSTTVPAAVGSNLNFVFECVDPPSPPKSWKALPLPGGLTLTHGATVPTNVYTNSITGIPTTAGSTAVTVTVWRDPNYGRQSVSQVFNFYILGFQTQPAASTTIDSGGTTILSCAATGRRPGDTLTYQWYQGTSGTTTTPVGTNSASFTTPALSSSTNYWVKITSTQGGYAVSANSNTAAVNVSAPASVVTVAVAPASVTEDGASDLTYTFTRTGATTAALTSNFTVGGTATFATDYAQTGAAGFTASSGTVTFPIGASTVVVTLNPTADSVVEADETAILTVTTGSGYTVGSPSAATGTITNDDTVYSSWASELPPSQAGPGKEPQGDGVTNLEKFAFNMNPMAADTRHLTVGANETGGLPGGAMAAGKLRIEFLRRKASTNPGITYTAQFGSDLVGWADISTGTPAGTSIDETWERVTVDDPAPGVSTARFGRVKVEEIP